MKILVVDDHELIREALRGVLAELQGEAVIVEVDGACRARHCLAEHPDVELVLLDLGLPDGDGFDVLAELREHRLSVAVVVLSASRERGDIERALELGAVGFIPKSARREVMLGALELILAGGIYVPPEILSAPPATARVPSRPSVPGVPGGLAALDVTERQREVLELMMQGRSNKAISRELDIAEPTVKNHVTAILRVLRATNRTEAVVAAAALEREPPGKGG